MGIVGGLDLHRRQITYDWLDTTNGETKRGVIRPATRQSLREWLAELARTDGAFALEATTGWRFVVEGLQRAGLEAHVAEPAGTPALRGKKRRGPNHPAAAPPLPAPPLGRAAPPSPVPPPVA